MTAASPVFLRAGATVVPDRSRRAAGHGTHRQEAPHVRPGATAPSRSNVPGGLAQIRPGST